MTLWELMLIFRKEKPDIVLNYTIKPTLYSSLIGGLFTKASIFSNITGLGYLFTDDSSKAKLLKQFVIKMYRVALSFNSKVFFQNIDDLNLFKELRLVRDKKTILLNGSGINLSKFPERSYENIEPNSFIFVGRLLKDKGIFELLAAMKKVKEQKAEAICYLIGDIDKDNPNSLSLQDLKKWEDLGVIKYLGRQSDVLPYLAQKGVFVLPSYREGTPRAILEAMSVGLPIITFNTPGCRETVINDENGFLVPFKEVDALADKILYFINNPTKVIEMGRKSRLLVESKYNVFDVNQKIFDTIGL